MSFDECTENWCIIIYLRKHHLLRCKFSSGTDWGSIGEKRKEVESKGPEANMHELVAIVKLIEALKNGVPDHAVEFTEEYNDSTTFLGLPTMKPVLFAANVADSDLAIRSSYVDQVQKYAAEDGTRLVVVYAQVEAKLVAWHPSKRANFLKAIGLISENCGLRALVRATYDLLRLQTSSQVDQLKLTCRLFVGDHSLHKQLL